MWEISRSCPPRASVCRPAFLQPHTANCPPWALLLLKPQLWITWTGLFSHIREQPTLNLLSSGFTELSNPYSLHRLCNSLSSKTHTLASSPALTSSREARDHLHLPRQKKVPCRHHSAPSRKLNKTSFPPAQIPGLLLNIPAKMDTQNQHLHFGIPNPNLPAFKCPLYPACWLAFTPSTFLCVTGVFFKRF